jgi:endoglucanase
MKASKTILIIIAVLSLAMCRAQGNQEPINPLQEELIRFIPASIIDSLPINPAMTFVRDMGIGINIGNSLDATGRNEYWHAGETGWGNPPITREFIRALKDFGYKSIRLPVTWYGYMGPAPDYLIGECTFPGCTSCPNRMDRVQQVVNWILDEGLYCIINVHHDEWIIDAIDDFEGTLDKYSKAWAQIAARFANAPDKLIFESMNEIGFDRIWNRWGGISGKNRAYDIFNTINQTFVDTVRVIPGNENRFLLIAGYWTDIGLTCDPLFKMPTDTVDHRLILSVHYYGPSTFCIAEERDNSWGFRDSWGTPTDFAELTSEFNKLKVTFLDKGIPVILGEYGVTLINKIEEDRIRWMAAVTQISLNYGICPMLWCTGWKINNEGRHEGGEILRNPPHTMRDSLKRVWEIVRQP